MYTNMYIIHYISTSVLLNVTRIPESDEQSYDFFLYYYEADFIQELLR